MKILLSALPRTGSKWLCFNFHLYLKARYKFVSELITHDKWNTRSPLTDWFTVNGDDLFFNGHINELGIHFELQSQVLPTITELQSRLKILENLDAPAIIKIHPVLWHELLAISSLKDKVEKHYTLRRRDQFDQCVSIMTCRYTNIWNRLGNLDKILNDAKNNPYTIPVSNFENQWNSLNSLTTWLDTLDNATHLYYEDLIKIKNDVEFCKWLDLPYVKFNLNFSYGIEYGEEKQKIIANYQELKKKFNPS